MILSKNKDMKEIKENWKSNGKKYLRELQAFLDKVENIESEELRKEIIFQMLKCDNELTMLAEEEFRKIRLDAKEESKDIEEDD